MHTLPRIFRFCTLAPLWGAKLACSPILAIVPFSNIADFQRFTAFTFAQSETLRVYVPTTTHGHTHTSVGRSGHPENKPNFLRKLPLHADSHPHPACDYCAPIMCAW